MDEVQMTIDPWNPPDSVTEAAARLSRHDAGETLEQIYGGEATAVDTVANAWYWQSDPKAVAAYEADRRAVIDWVKEIVKQRDEYKKIGDSYRDAKQQETFNQPGESNV